MWITNSALICSCSACRLFFNLYILYLSLVAVIIAPGSLQLKMHTILNYFSLSPYLCVCTGSENNSLYLYYKGLSKTLLTFKFDTVKSVLDKDKKEDDTNEFVSAVCWRALSDGVSSPHYILFWIKRNITPTFCQCWNILELLWPSQKELKKPYSACWDSPLTSVCCIQYLFVYILGLLSG